MADALDILRKDAFRKRVHGVAGANRVLWSEKDFVKLHDCYMAARGEEIVGEPVVVKFSSVAPDKAALAKMGIELRDFAPGDRAYLGIATNETTDHMNDSVKIPGVDDILFAKNPAVLDAHDSSKPPVASSSRLFASGNNLLSIHRFPQPGVSANSDQINAAVGAKLTRGLSIGFIPLRWSLSKDPSRPMGVDFHEIKLLEISHCAIPANPDCRVLGSMASNQSAPADPKMADRRREARSLADKARALGALIEDAAPLTRDQRIAEAQALRRMIGAK